MQAKAVREEAAALNEALQAEKAAKWAADAEAEELQKQLSDTEESLAKERWAEGSPSTCLIPAVGANAAWPSLHYAIVACLSCISMQLLDHQAASACFCRTIEQCHLSHC